MANDVISQPQGSGTDVKNGTIVGQGPLGAGSGVLGSDYTIDTYVSALPTTGTVFTKYKDRFDDYNYYSA
tara:strand:- start:2216 stop:2425 length:210 start_codon:yes stop_codon:yes gene_type:complete